MMVWTRRAAVIGLVAIFLGGSAGGPLGARRCAASEVSIPQSHSTPFDRMPLEPPLFMTGSFGEARNTHFHAGVDLSTGARVGMPVYAPRAGAVVRVRASGVGYGRSLYLLDERGWLLVLGHLDAFDEPLASYVAAAQDSAGQYEQDLWPDSARFRVVAGQRLGWSGRSGTGPPHLHLEARRGDMAYNPLLAGLVLLDTVPPRITRAVIEPLDGASSVEGGVAPHVVEFAGTGPQRVNALGRVRVLIEAVDARDNGRLTMAPWRTAMIWGGGWISITFDSVSWASGMAEVDYVYDRGRTGDHGSTTRRMWAPAGYRPVGLAASAALASEAGTLTRRQGDAPLEVTFVATDAAGNTTERQLVIAAGPGRTPSMPPAEKPKSAATPRPRIGNNLEFESIGGANVRVALSGPEWSGHVLELAAFGADTGRASGGAAILPATHPGTGVLALTTRAPSGRKAVLAMGCRLSRIEDGASDSLGALGWSVPAGSTYEPGVVAAEDLGIPAATPDLEPLGNAYALHPRDLALRAAIRVGLAVPARAPGPDATKASGGAAGSNGARTIGLYLERGEGWEFVRSERGPIDRWVGETRRLGRFALFRDVRAPRVRLLAAPKRSASGPYPRWALEALLTEAGSGVDPRATYFEIDGRRVASEWDPEEHVLRWRPRVAARAGRHRARVIAADRAGNVARVTRTFVLE